MDVRNCKSCGKMFNYIGHALCPQCMSALEDKFQEVKTYIQDNPSANVTQVAEETEVSVHQLKKWVREERLSFSDSSLVGLNCEKCGKLIKTGRFCELCKQSLGNALAESIKPSPAEQIIAKRKKQNTKMHFLDNH